MRIFECIKILISASILLTSLSPAVYADKANIIRNDVEPLQRQDIEGFLFPGQEDDWGWPEQWSAFYLDKDQEVGITIMWNPAARMEVGIIYSGNSSLAYSTTPIQGNEVVVSAPSDGLYVVRIKNVDDSQHTQYSGHFIIKPP